MNLSGLTRYDPATKIIDSGGFGVTVAHMEPESDGEYVKFEDVQAEQWVSVEGMNERAKARFWSKADHSEFCWEWRGSCNRHGYGVFRDGAARLAHRIAYEIVNGPLPDGAQVLHRCDNPRCINPDHLFVGDPAANAQDKAIKGRGRILGRSSRYRGVGWRSDSKRWRAYLKWGDISVALGCHATEEDAARAFDCAVVAHSLPKQLLNFPSPPEKP